MKNLVVATMGFVALFGVEAHAGGQLDPKCGQCHALTKPTDASLDRLINRKAPDLWYAGSKFNEAWLVKWLQDPKPLRPAGYPYFKTIMKGGEHDVPDPSKVTPHPVLDKGAAEAAAAALMALKAPPELVPPGAYKSNASAARMGALAFNKLRGCVSCHEGADGQGGLSGPELTDAGARLQPDFIVAYINDPQRFDPHVWMPTLSLKDQDVQRLAAYLEQQGGEEK